MKTMITLTIFEILLFEGKPVLGPAERVPGSERIKHNCSLFIIIILPFIHIMNTIF